MKKSMKSRLVLTSCLLTAVLFFGNKLSAQASTKTAFAEKLAQKMSLNINFSIQASTCFAGGTSLRVLISNPERYAFLWMVDGGHGGHQMNLECICGEYATLRIMRLSDGKQVTRTVKLNGCGSGANSN